MGLTKARHVSADELAAFRRRRGADWGASRGGSVGPQPGRAAAPAVASGDVVYVTKPKQVGKRREARDVRDALTDRRLASILNASPETLRQLAKVYREKYPDLAKHMTDQEIVTVTIEAASRRATERAFKDLGRG